MRNHPVYGIALALLVLLAGCRQDQPPPLPTLIDLPAEVTARALPTAAQPGDDPTSPPTLTPAATPTGAAGEQPGEIFYIYNGDAIIALAPDGSRSELIITFGPDRPISDLSVSPDGELLAFVAPGNDGSREVYVASRDGVYIQRVSCLDFAVVRGLDWSPDGQTLAFVAAQFAGGPADIYAARWIGSTNCPQGNDQRSLLERSSRTLAEVAYHPDGDRLYFVDGAIYALDLNSGELSDALTAGRSDAPDSALTFHPAEADILAYRRMDRGSGVAVIMDVSNPADTETETGFMVERIDWNASADRLLLSAGRNLQEYHRERRSLSTLRTGSLPPRAVYSPDGGRIAYIDADANDPRLPQIFVIEVGGTGSRQITAHSEGSITEMIWAGE
jgi:Tol biopolymer transport system component